MRGVLVVALVAGCGADRFGAYLEIHSDVGFDHLELFFGGAFQQRKSCGSASLANPPAVVATAAWTPATSMTAANQDPARVTMWRRQYHADTDSKDFPAGTTSYTVRLPTLEDDADFTDTLGSELFVFATATHLGQIRHEYAEVKNIVAPKDFVNEYDIPLGAIESDHEVEQWGAPGDFACIRNTYDVPGAQATSFIVREWDHDCDGVPTQLCPAGSEQVIDCDPETYCVPGANELCPVPEGCSMAAINPTTSGEMVCQLGTCSNPGGQRTCEITTTAGGLPTCIGQDMCDVPLAQCDRRFASCAAIDANPDILCTIPAMTTNNQHFMCDTTTEVVVALPLTGGNCPLVAEVIPRGNALAEVAFDVTSMGGSQCQLSLSPMAVHGFNTAGFLPTTRLLLSFGPETTMLVDVAASQMCGDTPMCAMGSGDAFAGTAHTCLGP